MTCYAMNPLKVSQLETSCRDRPFLLVGWGIGRALAAGNTVVSKPAEETPFSTPYLSCISRKRPKFRPESSM